MSSCINVFKTALDLTVKKRERADESKIFKINNDKMITLCHLCFRTCVIISYHQLHKYFFTQIKNCFQPYSSKS